MPRLAEDGKIVVMGVPVLEGGFPAMLIQGIVRYNFQRALLRRDIQESPRPVFIEADEFQSSLSSMDQDFFALSRAFRVINICLTQNIPNLYAALGGEQRGKAQVDSILGNLNTKILMANSCSITNNFASSLLGTCRRYRFGTSVTSSGNGWPGMNNGSPPQISANMNEVEEPEMRPAEWTRLRPGGRRCRYLADAIVFQNGRIFADTGKTWRRVTFRQQF